MSYCVNCGVELDATATACPLCNTKIYNPNQPVATDIPTPYATVKGHTEPVKQTYEFAILMTIIFLTTSLVCFFLNTFTIQIGHWSFYVAGICAMLWVFLLPAFFPQNVNLYGAIALDGVIIALNIAVVSWLHPGNGWFWHIALPITILTTLLLEIVLTFFYHLKSSMIGRTAICVSAIAVLCIAIEMVIDLHLRNYFYLRWSAIVATCAVAIDIVLLTIYLQEGLRAEIRRRMHF
ncbi:MAG: hypothetical protein IJ024_03500 [Lachnospiraceae bacterium]|nr:hypothetical protein [Lachnospiraceae bacterium]